MHDESPLTIVTMRSDGFIEELFVSRTGQHVHAGEPLFRVYSPDIERAQVDLIVAMGTASAGADAGATPIGISRAPCSGCATSAFPESRIRDVRETGVNPAPSIGPRRPPAT